MYDKILVPLDGSQLAEVALPYAEELAGRLGSKIILFQALPRAHHVYAAEGGATQIPYTEEEMGPLKANTTAYLEKVVSGLKDRGIATRIETAILVGDPASEIVDYADKEVIDLIVLATHGRSGISRWVLGSVADRVVRSTKRPIALIRAKDSHPDVREKFILDKILVPLDGSKESEMIIPYVEELVSRLKTEVTLFQAVPRAYHVYAGGEAAAQVPYTDEEMNPIKADTVAYLEKVADGLRSKGITVRCEARVGTSAEGIIKLADEIHTGMVAMTTHGRSGVSRWVFGSVTDKVLNAGNTPLLLVRLSQDSTK